MKTMKAILQEWKCFLPQAIYNLISIMFHEAQGIKWNRPN